MKFPKSFTTKKLQFGETTFRKNGNLLALRMLDKSDLYFLSSMHKLQLTQTRKKDREGNPIQKQKLVDDYNLHMGGVDKNDTINGNYSSVRKSHKWTTKVALHFLEEAIFNAFVLYRKCGDGVRSCDFKRAIEKLISYCEFCRESTSFLTKKMWQTFPGICSTN